MDVPAWAIRASPFHPGRSSPDDPSTALPVELAAFCPRQDMPSSSSRGFTRNPDHAKPGLTSPSSTWLSRETGSSPSRRTIARPYGRPDPCSAIGVRISTENVITRDQEHARTLLVEALGSGPADPPLGFFASPCSTSSWKQQKQGSGPTLKHFVCGLEIGRATRGHLSSPENGII